MVYRKLLTIAEMRVISAVKKVIGDEFVAVGRLNGENNSDYLLRGSRGELYVLRVSGLLNSDGSEWKTPPIKGGMNHESKVLHHLRHEGVPVPEVVRSGVALVADMPDSSLGQQGARPWMLQKFLHGKNAAEEWGNLPFDTRLSVAVQALKMLAPLHKCDAAVFLRFRVSPVLGELDKSRTPYDIDYMRERIDGITGLSVEEKSKLLRRYDVLLKIASRGAPGAWAPHMWPGAKLIHGDINPGNILLDESGNVCGIVDFEFARGGLPDADIMSVIRREYELRYVYAAKTLGKSTDDPLVRVQGDENFASYITCVLSDEYVRELYDNNVLDHFRLYDIGRAVRVLSTWDPSDIATHGYFMELLKSYAAESSFFDRFGDEIRRELGGGITSVPGQRPPDFPAIEFRPEMNPNP